jgi:hypothetical protein
MKRPQPLGRIPRSRHLADRPLALFANEVRDGCEEAGDSRRGGEAATQEDLVRARQGGRCDRHW